MNLFKKISYYRKKAWHNIMGYCGAGGPNCPCCQHMSKRDIKHLSNKLIRNDKSYRKEGES